MALLPNHPWPDCSLITGKPYPKGAPKCPSGSDTAHPGSADLTLLRCSADRPNQISGFRFTGSPRQPIWVARLVIWSDFRRTWPSGCCFPLLSSSFPTMTGVKPWFRCLWLSMRRS
jgi:hypothetical protein